MALSYFNWRWERGGCLWTNGHLPLKYGDWKTSSLLRGNDWSFPVLALWVKTVLFVIPHLRVCAFSRIDSQMKKQIEEATQTPKHRHPPSYGKRPHSLHECHGGHYKLATSYLLSPRTSEEKQRSGHLHIFQVTMTGVVILDMFDRRKDERRQTCETSSFMHWTRWVILERGCRCCCCLEARGWDAGGAK